MTLRIVEPKRMGREDSSRVLARGELSLPPKISRLPSSVSPPACLDVALQGHKTARTVPVLKHLRDDYGWCSIHNSLNSMAKVRRPPDAYSRIRGHRRRLKSAGGGAGQAASRPGARRWWWYGGEPRRELEDEKCTNRRPSSDRGFGCLAGWILRGFARSTS